MAQLSAINGLKGCRIDDKTTLKSCIHDFTANFTRRISAQAKKLSCNLNSQKAKNDGESK